MTEGSFMVKLKQKLDTSLHIHVGIRGTFTSEHLFSHTCNNLLYTGDFIGDGRHIYQ